MRGAQTRAAAAKRVAPVFLARKRTKQTNAPPGAVAPAIAPVRACETLPLPTEMLGEIVMQLLRMDERPAVMHLRRASRTLHAQVTGLLRNPGVDRVKLWQRNFMQIESFLDDSPGCSSLFLPRARSLHVMVPCDASRKLSALSAVLASLSAHLASARIVTPFGATGGLVDQFEQMTQLRSLAVHHDRYDAAAVPWCMLRHGTASWRVFSSLSSLRLNGARLSAAFAHLLRGSCADQTTHVPRLDAVFPCLRELDLWNSILPQNSTSAGFAPQHTCLEHLRLPCRDYCEDVGSIFSVLSDVHGLPRLRTLAGAGNMNSLLHTLKERPTADARSVKEALQMAHFVSGYSAAYAVEPSLPVWQLLEGRASHPFIYIVSKWTLPEWDMLMVDLCFCKPHFSTFITRCNTWDVRLIHLAKFKWSHIDKPRELCS